MANIHRGTRAAVDEALAQFYKAIELDPDFASAYAMAAWCYFWRKFNGWMVDRAQEIAEGTRLARRAVELGTDDAVALARSGHALVHLTGDLDGGIALIGQGEPAQSEPRRGLVSRRVPAGSGAAMPTKPSSTSRAPCG